MDAERIIPCTHNNDVTGCAAKRAWLCSVQQLISVKKRMNPMPGAEPSPLSVCLCLSGCSHETGFLRPEQKFNWNNIRGGPE